MVCLRQLEVHAREKNEQGALSVQGKRSSQLIVGDQWRLHGEGLFAVSFER